MRLDISDVLKEAGKILPYVINEPPLVDEDVECTKPIDGDLTFNNTGGLLLINGKANTWIAQQCSRCEEYFELPVMFTIDEQFELNQQAAGRRTLQTVTILEEDENPIAGKLFDGHVLDLTELLRQYILIEEPTRPLPEPLEDERCSHCLKTPQEVLMEGLGNDNFEPETAPKINPAFAKLGKLLEQPAEE